MNLHCPNARHPTFRIHLQREMPKRWGDPLPIPSIGIGMRPTSRRPPFAANAFAGSRIGGWVLRRRWSGLPGVHGGRVRCQRCDPPAHPVASGRSAGPSQTRLWPTWRSPRRARQRSRMARPQRHLAGPRRHVGPPPVHLRRRPRATARMPIVTQEQGAKPIESSALVFAKPGASRPAPNCSMSLGK
jgi:hypothetical protein